MQPRTHREQSTGRGEVPGYAGRDASMTSSMWFRFGDITLEDVEVGADPLLAASAVFVARTDQHRFNAGKSCSTR